jgi:hypothetical protein
MKIWTNNFFTQHIVPGRYAAVAEKKIIKNYNLIEKADTYDFPEGDKEVFLDQLIKNIGEQLDRKKGLEDKVKAILFSISISITAITFSLSYEQNTIKTMFGIITLITLLLSVIYFISSAIIAVKTLIPVGFGSIQADVRFDVANKKISLVVPDAESQLQQLLKDKLLNDNVNLRISNTTYASLKLLRNGIILFAAYFVLALSQKVFQKKSAQPQSFKGTVQIKVNDSVRVKIGYHYINKNQLDLLIDSIKTDVRHSTGRKFKKINSGSQH